MVVFSGTQTVRREEMLARANNYSEASLALSHFPSALRLIPLHNITNT